MGNVFERQIEKILRCHCAADFGLIRFIGLQKITSRIYVVSAQRKKPLGFKPWGLKPLPILEKSDKGGGDVRATKC
jgi:hypothetical protein